MIRFRLFSIAVYLLLTSGMAARSQADDFVLPPAPPSNGGSAVQPYPGPTNDLGMTTVDAYAGAACAPGGEFPTGADYGPNPYPYECAEECEDGFFARICGCFRRKAVRHKKEPFQHYMYNERDLQERPVIRPYCVPVWGYHETCWRPFPPMPNPCERIGFPAACPIEAPIQP